eukprot:15449514-Alexandrium_andersonii.AAC.1
MPHLGIIPTDHVGRSSKRSTRQLVGEGRWWRVDGGTSQAGPGRHAAHRTTMRRRARNIVQPALVPGSG